MTNVKARSKICTTLFSWERGKLETSNTHEEITPYAKRWMDPVSRMGEDIWSKAT
jgi:hypothetical protein